jgi:septum formation protein
MMREEKARIILASASPSRAALLNAAGLDVEIDPADVDEGAIRTALEGGDGVRPSDVAEVLARVKAERVSARAGDALVIGADQLLELEGRIFEKPPDMKAARQSLLALRGRTHHLHSCVAVARSGETVWSHTASAHMTMRDLTPEFIGNYLAQAGDKVLSSVGAYQLEALGVHLFEEVEGDYFTILGLPLLPLLAYLRGQGAILS